MKKLILLTLVVLASCTTVIQQPGEPAEPEPTAAPVIASFIADPPTITEPGQFVTLTWGYAGDQRPTTIRLASTTNPDGKLIDAEYVSQVFNPIQTTTYTLTVANQFGEDTKSVTVTVTLQ